MDRINASPAPSRVPDARSVSRPGSRRAQRVLLAAVLLVGLRPGSSEASSDTGGRSSSDRYVHTFALDWSPASGRGVFLLGDVPELGEGDVRRAVRLFPLGGRWTARVELPAGRDVACRYYERDLDPLRLGSPSNGSAISDVFVLKARNESGERGLLVHQTIPHPLLHWRLAGAVEFTPSAMKDLGPGRFEEERLWRAQGFGRPLRAIEFFLSDRDGRIRDPVAGTYRLVLERAFLQDGELFGHVPAAQVDAQRRDYLRSAVPSLWSQELGALRRYRVMLPRGYEQHPERRYPVLYLYDGQHLWDRAGGWDPGGRTGAELVASGRVAELIQVAIDTPGSFGRMDDTFPPDDHTPFTGEPGRADRFLRFVRDELKPFIDARYRTLPGPRHTLMQGFSMGGVLALYAAFDFDATFGAVGAQSPALGATPRFFERLRAGGPSGARIYADMGDLEAPELLVTLARSLQLGEPPWVLWRELVTSFGFGHVHTYADAGRRIETMLEALAPARTEAALESYFHR